MLLRRPIEQRRARAGSWPRPHPERHAAAAGKDGKKAGNELGAALAFGCLWLRGCSGRGSAFMDLQQLREAASMLDTTPGLFGCRGRVGGGRQRRRVRSSLVRSLWHARKRTERGERPATHHYHDERVGEVGEELMKTGGRRRSRRPNDEDEVGGGVSGRPASRE